MCMFIRKGYICILLLCCKWYFIYFISMQNSNVTFIDSVFINKYNDLDNCHLMCCLTWLNKKIVICVMKKKSICSSLGRFRACILFQFFKHDWNMFSKSQYKGEASKDYQQFGNTLRKKSKYIKFCVQVNSLWNEYYNFQRSLLSSMSTHFEKYMYVHGLRFSKIFREWLFEIVLIASLLIFNKWLGISFDKINHTCICFKSKWWNPFLIMIIEEHIFTGG